jgi:hypothetical protein
MEMAKELEKPLTRKEALKIIELMSWIESETRSKLIKKDFARLSDRLMEITHDR